MKHNNDANLAKLICFAIWFTITWALFVLPLLIALQAGH